MKNKASLLTLTDKNFNHQVLENVQPVLVHFRTDWSGTSYIITAIIEELALQFSGKVAFGTIDIDAHSQVAKKFGIASVPTLLFFCNGRVIDRITGVISKSELIDKLKSL